MAKSGTKAGVGRPMSAGAQETREALVRGAIEALKEEGFAGASAREIARRAGCNQGLVFYHFGSVTNLLLAALDDVSATRHVHYQAAVERADGLGELVDAAEAVFEEDLDAGHIAVLAEMIAGASATPGLGPEVAARIAPWRQFAADALGGVLSETPLAAVVEPEVAAHAVVALYLGLEMLAHLDGDRSAALALFARARQLAALAADADRRSGRSDRTKGGGMTRGTLLGVEEVGVSMHDFPDRGFDVVTGAFSYSGAAITREVERSGRRVRTLTGHPGRARPDSGVDVRPLDFDDIVGLTSSLEGATTLYNTYWVRFPHGEDDHDRAVANSRVLFHAARRAGVERIVHVSITHPSISSPYAYFSGKAKVERALAEVGVPYAVLRPAILFGGDGVLLNNIAWLLRRLPVFGVGGRGDYRIRAVHIDDLAALAVAAGAERADTVLDAVGPERPTFLELVRVIRDAVGSRSLIVKVPGVLIPSLASVLGLVLRDVLLTGDEFRAMEEGLADTDGPATGTTEVSGWIRAHGDTLGRSYANEIERHFRQPGR